jgi:demethylspheroidene O-methyltransferase
MLPPETMQGGEGQQEAPLWQPPVPGGVLGHLRERWFATRDMLLRDPRFLRFAASFPLTRSLARKRQSELFDLVSGFVYTQILSAVTELKLLETVAEAPLSKTQLSARFQMPLDGLARLVEGAVALRLLNLRKGENEPLYGLGDLGAALLGNPGVIAMVRHHAILYRDLADPIALLRREKEPELSRYWAYASTQAPAELGSDRVDDYSALMAISQGFIASEILGSYNLDQHQHVVDLGGGEGAFVTEALRATARPRFTVFDLPAVAERARARFAREGHSARAAALGGDLFAGDLPEDADLYCLIRVLYDHSDARIRQILRSVRASMQPGATLLVAEPMAGTKGAERMGAAYFGMYLFAMKGGRSRHRDELIRFLTEAGFRDVKALSTASPMLTSVILAKA